MALRHGRVIGRPDFEAEGVVTSNTLTFPFGLTEHSDCSLRHRFTMESSKISMRIRKRDAITSRLKNPLRRTEDCTHGRRERNQENQAEDDGNREASSDLLQDRETQGSETGNLAEAEGADEQKEQHELDAWKIAEGKLEAEKPSVYGYLQALKGSLDEPVDKSFSRANEVINKIKSDLRQTEKKLSPEESRTRRSLFKAASKIMAVKDVLAPAARADPTGATPFVLAGITSVLSVSVCPFGLFAPADSLKLALKKDDLDHVISIDLQDVCSKILFWANEDARVLQRGGSYADDKHKAAKSALVDLYASILDWNTMS